MFKVSVLTVAMVCGITNAKIMDKDPYTDVFGKCARQCLSTFESSAINMVLENVDTMKGKAINFEDTVEYGKKSQQKWNANFRKGEKYHTDFKLSGLEYGDKLSLKRIDNIRKGSNVMKFCYPAVHAEYADLLHNKWSDCEKAIPKKVRNDLADQISLIQSARDREFQSSVKHFFETFTEITEAEGPFVKAGVNVADSIEAKIESFVLIIVAFFKFEAFSGSVETLQKAFMKLFSGNNFQDLTQQQSMEVQTKVEALRTSIAAIAKTSKSWGLAQLIVLTMLIEAGSAPMSQCFLGKLFAKILRPLLEEWKGVNGILTGKAWRQMTFDERRIVKKFWLQTQIVQALEIDQLFEIDEDGPTKMF